MGAFITFLDGPSPSEINVDNGMQVFDTSIGNVLLVKRLPSGSIYEPQRIKEGICQLLLAGCADLLQNGTTEVLSQFSLILIGVQAQNPNGQGTSTLRTSTRTLYASTDSFFHVIIVARTLPTRGK